MIRLIFAMALRLYRRARYGPTKTLSECVDEWRAKAPRQ